MKLWNYLKNKYDYIIIDTTPAGLVADASLVMKYACLFCWSAETIIHEKMFLMMCLICLSINKFENFDVVFNDLNIKKSRYGRYNDYYKNA